MANILHRHSSTECKDKNNNINSELKISYFVARQATLFNARRQLFAVSWRINLVPNSPPKLMKLSKTPDGGKKYNLTTGGCWEIDFFAEYDKRNNCEHSYYKLLYYIAASLSFRCCCRLLSGWPRQYNSAKPVTQFAISKVLK